MDQADAASTTPAAVGQVDAAEQVCRAQGFARRAEESVADPLRVGPVEPPEGESLQGQIDLKPGTGLTYEGESDGTPARANGKWSDR